MKIFHKILNSIIVLVLATTGVSFFMKKQLPPPTALLKEINQTPIQQPTTAAVFSFDYRGIEYKVTPRADYELWGLVVSHNDISSISDIYHDEDSVDLKDVCVVWGSNAKSGVYAKGKYKSGSWTCYWQFKDGDAWSAFNQAQIANNHLIASDLLIQEKIRKLRIGDQVHLKGYLVDYTRMDNDWRRQTSMTRKDTGNHACEVVYVKELDVLRASNEQWYLVWYWGKIAFLMLIAFKIILVAWESHRDLKKMEKSLTASKKS